MNRPRAQMTARSDGGDKLADGSDSARSRRRSAPKSAADPDDDTIRVSLGRPEPLPGVALALASPGRQASTGAGSQWKADKERVAGRRRRRSRRRPRSSRTFARRNRRRQSAQEQPAVATRTGKPILSRAEAKLDALQTYQMRVSRLERVNGQLQPEEEILLSIRRDPKAVRLEWASGPSKGREVIYSSSARPADDLRSHAGHGDSPSR